MRRLLILGFGYVGAALARRAQAGGWEVVSAGRRAEGRSLSLDDPALAPMVEQADAIVSTVPPVDGADPILQRLGGPLAARRGALVYLSSTGVYGDTGGAWVDETYALGQGQRSARIAADLAWLELGAAVARLGGIYGPGRSAFDRLRAGTAQRIDRPGHRFSRIHVDDIAGGVLALIESGLSGPFNIVDEVPAEPAEVVLHAARLLGMEPPPLVALDAARLSPMAMSFWTERRLVAGRRLPRSTGYRLRYPDYKVGLEALASAENRR